MLNIVGSSDLKTTFYRDLLTHGTSLYQEVIIKFCANYVQSNDVELQMSKNDTISCRELFQVTHKEFTDRLEHNIPTFNQAHIA